MNEPPLACVERLASMSMQDPDAVVTAHMDVLRGRAPAEAAAILLASHYRKGTPLDLCVIAVRGSMALLDIPAPPYHEVARALDGMGLLPADLGGNPTPPTEP